MKKSLVAAILLFFLFNEYGAAQSFNKINEDGQISNSKTSGKDTTNNKEIPIGIYAWTVDKRYGDVKPAELDTMPHMFMNNEFTNGERGEYNFLGNLGSPRIARIFIDRPENEQFVFTQTYDYTMTPIEKLQFFNTLSPITNLTYQTGGNKTNGQDRLKAIFAVNANKKLGFGLKMDYLYGRGYYADLNTSFFNTTFFTSYIGEKYNMHFVFSTNHQKVAQNGGITDDNYITHPEVFPTFNADEIPTVLSENWNRDDNQHLFLTHRYNIGFTRKVKMTEAEIKARDFAKKSEKENHDNSEKNMKNNDKDEKDKPKPMGRPDNAKVVGNELPDTLKHQNERIAVRSKQQQDSLMALDKAKNDSLSMMKDEFVPVTSFIHTLEWHHYDHTYLAYKSPSNYYSNTYFNLSPEMYGDSIHDETRHYSIKNTFAIALLEGFNKYAKAGLKVFAAHELRHFSMPDSTAGRTSYNEHNVSVGGSIIKSQGKMFHYQATAETYIVGADAGQLCLDGNGDMNFKLFNDTIQLSAHAYFHRLNPGFYFRNYQSKHFWWNNSLDKEIRTRIEGILTLKRTKTSLRVAIDELKNYTYLSQSYAIDTTNSYARKALSVKVEQSGSPINVITAEFSQDFKLGPLYWENVVTYQHSNNQDALPLPTLNLYSNLYLSFRIAKVLLVNLGGDVRYFTKYYAPDFSPALNQFCVQGNETTRVEIGSYPIVNVYANLHLKHTRFYISMTHVNAGSGNSNYFLVPHYPINPMTLHMGVSWNFFN